MWYSWVTRPTWHIISQLADKKTHQTATKLQHKRPKQHTKLNLMKLKLDVGALNAFYAIQIWLILQHIPSENVWMLAVPRSKNKEMWTTMFPCFWFHFMEHTSADHVWPITDTDSVLCALEDCSILHSLWNTVIAPLWQFRLLGLLREQRFLTYRVGQNRTVIFWKFATPVYVDIE